MWAVLLWSHFVHQETKTLNGYINCPVMMRQSLYSNPGLSDFKALAPNCSNLLAKLNLTTWPDQQVIDYP